MSFSGGINSDTSKCDLLEKFQPSEDHDEPLWTERDQRICTICSHFRKYSRTIQIESKIIDKLIETLPREFQITSENLPRYQFRVTIVVANFYGETSVSDSYSAARNNASKQLYDAFKRLINLIENFEQIASKNAFPACMEQFIENNCNMIKITAEKMNLNNQYQSRFDIWYLRQFFATASDAMEVLLSVANKAYRYLQFFSKQLDCLVNGEQINLEIQKSIPCIELINNFISISQTNTSSSPIDVVTCLIELDPAKFEFNQRNNRRILSVVSLGNFCKATKTESEFCAEAFNSIFKHLSGLAKIFNSFKSMYEANGDNSAIIETLAKRRMFKITENLLEDGIYNTNVYIVHLCHFCGQSIYRDEAKRIAYSQIIKYLKVTSRLIN